MKTALRRLLWLSLLLAIVLPAGAAYRAWQMIDRPYQAYDGEQLIEVRTGTSVRRILADLEAAGVVPDARLARAFLVYRLGDPSLKAGEYLFDAPMSTAEVLDKLIRGRVVTYPVTLIEGLTLEETADSLARQGVGDAETFRREMQRSDLVADLDPVATDLEGYLYPDTYHFARGTSAAEIVATMVRTFRQRLTTEVEPLRLEHGERTVREVVILASIVEKEARVDYERPEIAGVYAHRLRIGMALYADPTVIYAIKRLGRWDGNLRRPDLKLDSPYNTYVYPGLPPGPICSPGVASLAAAAAPAETRHLYFVSRNDGTHVFAETLRDHNRNVARWQKQYWRERWAREKRGR